MSRVRGLRPVALLLCCGLACGDGSSTDAAVDGAPADRGVDLAREGGSSWPDLDPQIDHGAPCAQERLAVEAEMAQIALCTMPAECTSTPGECPFGCHIPYNKAKDTAKLKQLIAQYKANKACLPCSYDCPPPTTPDCVGGRCVLSGMP